MTNVDELLRASGLPRDERKDVTANGTRRVYLHAGQLHAASEPTEIVTILGSCVSVCLYDAARGVGGVNHFLLPTDSIDVSPRYARHAIDLLLEQLVVLGAARPRMEAKVFGGASVLWGKRSANELGSRNVEAARAKLAQEGIPVVGEDVGGGRGRKLIFLTADGSALVREV